MPSEHTPLLGSPAVPTHGDVESGAYVAPPVLARTSSSLLSSSETSTLNSSGSSSSSSGNNDVLRDIIIGFSDGLTVPFSLTAGLSSLGSTKLVIMGGLAELFSGMISMGLGAYLAASTEHDHYVSEERREYWEVQHKPGEEREEIFDILGSYGVSREAATSVVEALCKDHHAWVRFMMDYELKMERPNTSRAWISGLTMGLSYFIGGLIPMLPYFFMAVAHHALWVSVGITMVVLLVFGYVKNVMTLGSARAGAYGAVQTLAIGMAAAGASYVIVRFLDYGGDGKTGTPNMSMW
ncbi:Vacuolar iron transporter 1.1 [Ceratocystis lukuohia]|uniref:Vacuolar iron transporter 1.1 n=2 Tax=Ceratocystis TaxID=5157 RepID=A0A0F8B566_CERFI|nr:Vacuolar iron transporter 1.1 [Ceratocystis platani]